MSPIRYGQVLASRNIAEVKSAVFVASSFFVYAGAVASGLARGLDDPSTFIWPPLIFAVLTLASWALRPQSRILGILFPKSRSRRASVSSPQAHIS